MKLYYSPAACSMAAHIVAREASLDIDMEKVDLSTHITERGDDYRKINPKGYVPALLLDDRQLLTEAAVVIQYLGDRNPQAGLLPAASTIERYRLLEWLNFISTELHKGFGPLWNPKAPEETKQQAKDKLAQRFDYIADALKDRQYLTGSAFTVADAYLFTILNWTHPHRIDLGRWPVLQTYMARVGSREAVRQAMQEEGLVEAS